MMYSVTWPYLLRGESRAPEYFCPPGIAHPEISSKIPIRVADVVGTVGLFRSRLEFLQFNIIK